MYSKNIKHIKSELKKLSVKKNAKILQRFFKTGSGEYGEGDIFIGVKMPQIRAIVKRYSHIPLSDCDVLIKSKIHEERMTAVLLLVYKFQKNINCLEKIFKMYLKNMQYINNWDLVDLSADKILGAYLNEKDKNLLFDLSKSESLWERRISMLSTFHYIKKNEFKIPLKIARELLYDEHDLIHKAVGWMLREIGKRDLDIEEKFLNKYYKEMPRTMLRYSIERFPEKKRQAYLKGTIK